MSVSLMACGRMMRVGRGVVVALAGAATLTIALPAASHAQTYPDRPVRMLIPFSPGGSADVLCRITAQALSKKWGQPVVVENKPGGNTVVGATLAVNSPPDGYTLFYTGDQTITINPLLYSSPYVVERDLKPVTLIAYNPSMLAVKKDLPVSSVAEFIALAKAKPDTVSFGSSGPGSVQRLSMEYFAQLAGIKLIHVPYRGSNETVADMLAGSVDSTMNGVPNFTQLAATGQVKVLAATGDHRAPQFPDTPTIAEVGGPALRDYQTMGWFGLFVPAGVPQAIIDKVQADVAEAIKTDELKKIMEDRGFEVVANTPAQFAKIIHDDTERWRKVIVDGKLKAE